MRYVLDKNSNSHGIESVSVSAIMMTSQILPLGLYSFLFSENALSNLHKSLLIDVSAQGFG